MLTRSEFRQLFGLPKKRRTLTKKSSSKVTKKTSTHTSKPVRRKTASKTVSKVGKKVVRKTSTKLGKKIVAGKLRTIYKSKNGSKYYKKVSKGKVYRTYLGKPVLRKVARKPVRKTRTTRFGYQNTSARSLGSLMGPADLSGNSVNVVAKKAPATAAFGKRRRRTTRFGYVSGSARNLTGMMGPYPLSAANGSAIPSASFGKKRRVAAKKPVRKTATKAGKKVVRRSSRFGLMHGRPSQLASGPFPF